MTPAPVEPRALAVLPLPAAISASPIAAPPPLPIPSPPPPPTAGRPASGTPETAALREAKAAAKRIRKKMAREAMAARRLAEGVDVTGVEPAGGLVAAVRRPGAITLLATMNLVLGAAHLLVAWAALSGRLGATSGGPVDGMAAVLDGLLGLLLAATALWLLALHPLGRYVQVAVALFGLFAGFGSVLASVPLLIYFFRPGVKLLFSGRDPVQFSDDERTRVWKQASSPLLVPAAVLLQLLRSAIDLGPALVAILAG